MGVNVALLLYHFKSLLIYDQQCQQYIAWIMMQKKLCKNFYKFEFSQFLSSRCTFCKCGSLSSFLQRRSSFSLSGACMVHIMQVSSVMRQKCLCKNISKFELGEFDPSWCTCWKCWSPSSFSQTRSSPSILDSFVTHNQSRCSNGSNDELLFNWCHRFDGNIEWKQRYGKNVMSYRFCKLLLPFFSFSICSLNSEQMK